MDSYVIISLILMTALTYIVRVTPLLIFRKKIKSKWFQSFLYYVPSAVLTAMAFPTILTATGNWTTSIIGTVVALVLAFATENMMITALGAGVAAYIASFVF